MKLLWTIFVLSQLLGALGTLYSPHGSHALYFAVLLLLPGIILCLTLPSLRGVGFDFGYAMILVVTIPVNFAVWYFCALLIRKIRRQAFKGPSRQA